MKNLFINFIVDILSATADEINTNNDLAEFIREVLTENAELLKNVRDVERRKIIEIATNKFSLEYNKNIKLFWLTIPRYIYGDEIINSKTFEDQLVTPTVSIQSLLSKDIQFTQRSRKKMPNEHSASPSTLR